MTNRTLPLTLAAACGLMLALNSPGRGGQDKKPILTDEQFNKFVAADAKFLNEALAKEKIDKKLTRKIQASASLIIAYSGNSTNPATAHSRPLAEHLLWRVEEGDWQTAKGYAAKLDPLPTKKVIYDGAQFKTDVVHLMYFFASEKVGGFGVEMELGNYDDQKDKISDAQFTRLTELGYKMAVIAKDAERFGPEKDKGAATKKNWNAFATDMRETSLSLATAATAKNETDVRQALKKLDSACTNCHDVFK
ncbi:MAG TPA: cytochrome c [Gemmataceae bacterium]|nr:cytochrome c [Gemmataceae bacterium]